MRSLIWSSDIGAPLGGGESLVALLPVAGAELVGLQRIDDAEDLGKVGYPWLADIKRELASALGILHKDEGVALRATFIVDPEGVIRWASVNDLSVGRNPQEVLRILDALQTDELCPCNWQQGEETLKAA